jgi:hypothetical protein
MKKIASLFFCCCCVSLLTADLLAQVIGVPCPHTKPRTANCTTSKNCNSQYWIDNNVNCTSRFDVDPLQGLFGSESTTNNTESVVAQANLAPCANVRPCILTVTGCISGPDPWTVENGVTQKAVDCP